jgi:hypothetical protein
VGPRVGVGEGEEAGEILMMALIGVGVAGVDMLWLVVVDGGWSFAKIEVAFIVG